MQKIIYLFIYSGAFLHAALISCNSFIYHYYLQCELKCNHHLTPNLSIYFSTKELPLYKSRLEFIHRRNIHSRGSLFTFCATLLNLMPFKNLLIIKPNDLNALHISLEKWYQWVGLLPFINTELLLSNLL